jgi:anti-sigma B factor antagonist
MEITQKQYKHCDLVQVTGRVDSQTSPQLADVFKAITDDGRFKIVLDCSGLEFISSAGLWVLVNAQKQCKRYNRGEVVLAAVDDRIRGSLDLVGFIPYFRIVVDQTEAVGLF